jgi:triacylglycerol lipase
MIIDKQEILGVHLPLLQASYELFGDGRHPTSSQFEIVDVVTEPDRDERDGLWGFVAKFGACFAVAIRGTQTPGEWISDFTAISQPFNELPGFGFVHLGFEQRWRWIRPSIASALGRIPPGARVVFSGHSLGGAMAVLGSADVAINMRDRGFQVETFTIGAPRPGGIRFMWHFNRIVKKYLRVTSAGDIVPRTPTVLLPPFYAHPGTHLKVKGEGGTPHSIQRYWSGLEGTKT